MSVPTHRLPLFFTLNRGFYVTLFGKIKRFFGLSLNDEKAWNKSLWNLQGFQSLSGETVTEYTALTYSAVWNAIYQISGTIGSLPLHLMKRDDGNKRYATENSLYHVLHTQYNPYMTAKIGRQCMMAHILMWGNGYAEKVFNGYGDIAELWPIPPNRVIKIEMRENELWYEIDVGNERKWMPRKQILHIPGLGYDGFVGYSPIAMARKSIGLGMAMETFSSNYFGQGTHPGVIVSHPGQLNAEAHKNLKTSLTETYSGLGQSHRLMLLEDGLKLEKLGFSPEDSQFLESKQHHVADIARWFNMPPHKLKDLSKSSFNNIESENASYVIDTLLPLAVDLEQHYEMQLLPKAAYKQGFYFKHILEGLLRANSKDRAEFYKCMIGSGLMTPNEGRDKEDMNPSEHPLADELFMPAGLIPLSKFDEYLAKNAGKPPEPKALPAPIIEEGKPSPVDKTLKLLKQGGKS